MKRFLKAAASIALSVAMVLSMAACGQQMPVSAPPPPSESSSETLPAPEPAAGEAEQKYLREDLTAGQPQSAPESSKPDTAPPAHQEEGGQPEEQMISGRIIEAAMNSIVIETEDGRALPFGTADADKSGCHGLLIGSTVRIYYTGSVSGEDTSDAAVVRMEQDARPPL